MENSTIRQPRRPQLNWRAMVTLLILLSSIAVLISGIVMFVAPSGRVSRGLSWTLLGLDRAQWQTLHFSFAAVFVAIGILHLGYNWHGLLHHLRDRVSRHLIFKWEAGIALIATIWVAAAAILMLPPASSLHELNEYFRKSFWAAASVSSESSVPPNPTNSSAEEHERKGRKLPDDHPPIRADQPCSECHRQ